MKSYSSEELVQLIEDIWESVAHHGYGNSLDHVKIVANEPDFVSFSVTAQYSAPGFNYFHIQKLSELFETRNINLADTVDISGCETCDYGSRYGYELIIRPEMEISW
jgi:hypothetical protein